MNTEQSQVWQVVTTTDSEAEAQRLAALLIEERLAACAQVDGPIHSTYWWEGKAATDPEWRITIKTSATQYPDMARRLADQHTYDVPEILATEVVAGHPAYVQWVVDETQAEPR